ncbi:tetratricopeptide repeat protein [Rhizobium leguminosarum]|uniref:tetratricopeptide repeat protein n=1 Tax=Rhizobium leguminosarum TaxID=384 RepID=UPI001C95D4BC|nr:tetratricopeptide repeat protein [Rhizobium leguminosarum]MBY5721784.1 tetratricopeptide repeat protein [Rhizobium leguminosarum]
MTPATKFSRWGLISSTAATIQKVVLGFISTIAFICFAVLIYRAVTTPTISMLPISVPKGVADKGYTPEVLAWQLRSQLLSLVRGAKSSKAAAQIVSGPEFSAVTVPQTGMSLDMITSEIRKSFGMADFWEISGNLEPDGDVYRMKLLLERDGGFEILESDGNSDIKKVILTSAENILETVDPYLLASSYLDRDPDRARDLADHIIYTFPEGDPTIVWAHILKSAIYYNAQDASAALKEADTARLLAPRNAVAHLNRGSALMDLGRADEAMAALHESISLDPTDARPHVMLGTALKSTAVGKIDAAISQFRTAVELGNDDAISHYALANGLKVRGRDREEAATEFRKSIELDDTFALAHFGLANILCEGPVSDENLREALEHFQKAVAIAPKSTRFNNALTCAERLRARPIEQSGHVPIATFEGNCACTK